MPWWFIPLILGAIAVAAIALSEIADWLRANQNADSSHWELVRQKLNDGNYRVVAGIFNTRGYRTAEQTWQGQLDDDLKRKFGTKNVIRENL